MCRTAEIHEAAMIDGGAHSELTWTLASEESEKSKKIPDADTELPPYPRLL